MINSKHIKSLVADYKVEIIKAQRSETITEAIQHLKGARENIKKLEEFILEMKQTELDLTQDLYNKLKPGEKPYVKVVKL